MKGNQDIILQLGVLLRNELTAINQYFLHARMLKNWGFMKLADHEYKESIEEMKHADFLIERILMLEGTPDPQKMSKIVIGRDVPQILASDLALERGAHADLVPGFQAMKRGGHFPGAHDGKLQVFLAGRGRVDDEGGFADARGGQLAHLAGLELEGGHFGFVVEAHPERLDVVRLLDGLQDGGDFRQIGIERIGHAGSP